MGIQPSDGLIPHADRGEHAELMRLLREALPAGGKVLDCPSAVGYFSTLDTKGHFQFVAVDCIPESHYLADGPTYHQADLTEGCLCSKTKASMPWFQSKGSSIWRVSRVAFAVVRAG